MLFIEDLSEVFIFVMETFLQFGLSDKSLHTNNMTAGFMSIEMEDYASRIHSLYPLTSGKLFRLLSEEFQDVYDRNEALVNAFSETGLSISYLFRYTLYEQIPTLLHCISNAAKLINPQVIDSDSIQILDYSCTQGLATMLLLEKLSEFRKFDISRIKGISIVDPRINRLKHASIHLDNSAYKTEIQYINKELYDIRPSDYSLKSLYSIHIFGDTIETLNDLPFSFLASIKASRFLFCSYLFYHSIPVEQLSKDDLVSIGNNSIHAYFQSISYDQRSNVIDERVIRGFKNSKRLVEITGASIDTALYISNGLASNYCKTWSLLISGNHSLSDVRLLNTDKRMGHLLVDNDRPHRNEKSVFNQALLLYQGQDNESFIKALRLLENNTDDNKMVLNLQAVILAKLGFEKEALSLFQRIASSDSATSINSLYLYNLGICYKEGIGCDVDDNKAEGLFLKAVEPYEGQNPFPHSFLALGALYLKRGEKNKAIEFYEKAQSEDKDYSCAATTNLAQLNSSNKYLVSQEILANHGGCIACHECNNYDLSNRLCPKCQMWNFLESDTLEDLSDSEIICNSTAPAKQGYAAAQYLLGCVLIDKDSNSAYRWLKLAAEQNDANAQLCLYQYDFLKQSADDIPTLDALYWLALSACNNNAEAQFQMFLEYARGSFPQNEKEALLWLTKSSINGNSDAKKFLDSIREKEIQHKKHQVITKKNASNQYCVVNAIGETVVPFGYYLYISPFRHGLARVKTGNRFMGLRSFDGSLPEEALEYKWGIIDSNGREVVLPVYDYIVGFDLVRKEFTKASKDGKDSELSLRGLSEEYDNFLNNSRFSATHSGFSSRRTSSVHDGYSRKELDELYLDALEGDPSNIWNIE